MHTDTIKRYILFQCDKNKEAALLEHIFTAKNIA